MNLPNALTLVRFGIVPVFVLALVQRSVFSGVLAIVLFLLASVTDWLDGMLARRYGLSTPFGEFMDPLADKVLVGAAFITFSILPGVPVPVWLVVVILAREAAVTVMRIVGIGKGERMKTELAGKIKTAFQMFSITAVLVWLLAAKVAAVNNPDISLSWGALFWDSIVGAGSRVVYLLPLVLVSVSAALAVASMVLYAVKNRHLLFTRGGHTGADGRSGRGSGRP